MVIRYLIYQLLSLKLPFTGVNEIEIANKMRAGWYEEIEEPEDLRRLIKNLLKVNPNDRINYIEIKKLTFLKEYFEAYE